MEITTVNETQGRVDETMWKILDMEGRPGSLIYRAKSHFRIQHVMQKVVLFSSTAVLPKWANYHHEANGNKNVDEKGNLWWIDDVETSINLEGIIENSIKTKFFM
jgi:dolichyl-phosphate-mannose-protein mannosyltransferase